MEFPSRNACFFLCLVTGVWACSPVREPEATGKSTTAITASSKTIPGYQHTLNCSRFRIGQNTSLEINTSTFQRWRGSLGAFAIDPTNGAASAYIDAVAATEPYLTDVSTHNANVTQYFVGCGIPSDQIAGVDVNYEMTLTAAVADGPTMPVLSSINSTLRRVVQGVPVPDSIAWAKMTLNGDVDMENVFWPPLDATLVSTAVEFAGRIADERQLAAYTAGLPRTRTNSIGVVIHHTTPAIHASPVAYVSFDAEMSDVAGLHHFDVNGLEFRLPEEQLAGVSGVHPPR